MERTKQVSLMLVDTAKGVEDDLEPEEKGRDESEE
jgi:hypothetical protein